MYAILLVSSLSSAFVVEHRRSRVLRPRCQCAKTTELLGSIAGYRRRDGSIEAILAATERLEEAAVQGKESLGDISGRWSLVFSSMSSSSSSSSPFQDATDAVYKTLFRYLPALAGGFESTNPSNRAVDVRNEQVVDLENGVVENVVILGVGGARVEVRVRGLASAEDEATVGIVFEEVEARVLETPIRARLPLPRPRGSIVSTFIDDEVRISRGSRGGLFILRRLAGS
ncbi:hypothetical protein CTAYLR_008241 [Chrysophaeum taylorii]|uniref:Plastid lipid-associated protein/fibrillin conserved domain-containing protein n=1 Tax=Chrysophaeum taylorii TaxID=2483200 RepID=A0AAD7XPA8_9STRA|nr:hypothetical protein CTAYLR_008241 [Chrysophaeum taylorii]